MSESEQQEVAPQMEAQENQQSAAIGSDGQIQQQTNENNEQEDMNTQMPNVRDQTTQQIEGQNQQQDGEVNTQQVEVEINEPQQQHLQQNWYNPQQQIPYQNLQGQFYNPNQQQQYQQQQQQQYLQNVQQPGQIPTEQQNLQTQDQTAQQPGEAPQGQTEKKTTSYYTTKTGDAEVSQVTQEEDDAMYGFENFKLGFKGAAKADLGKALVHQEAKRVKKELSEELQENQEYCDCCHFPIQGEAYSLCCDNKELVSLGVGFPLYFGFIKYQVVIMTISLILAFPMFIACWIESRDIENNEDLTWAQVTSVGSYYIKEHVIPE